MVPIKDDLKNKPPPLKSGGFVKNKGDFEVVIYPQLKMVTFTGPDEQNTIDDLLAFQEQYSNAEIGVLVVPRLMGTKPGYPSRYWINEFAAAARSHPIALHLCEDAVHQFLNDGKKIWSLAAQFRRVQLNIFQGKDPVSVKLVDRAVKKFINEYDGQVILPMNPWNRQMILSVDSGAELLFDRSGGEGILPTDGWPTAITGRHCGYAGGLGPQNIHEQMPGINAAAGQATYWIDMQKKVRDEKNAFSINACAAVMSMLGYDAP